MTEFRITLPGTFICKEEEKENLVVLFCCRSHWQYQSYKVMTSEHDCDDNSCSEKSAPQGSPNPEKELRSRFVNMLQRAVRRGIGKLDPEIASRVESADCSDQQVHKLTSELEESLIRHTRKETNKRYRKSIVSLVINLGEGGVVLEALLLGFVEPNLLASIWEHGDNSELRQELQDSKDASYVPLGQQNSRLLTALQPLYPLIFSFLTAKEFAQLQRVCRSLKGIAGANVFWYAYCGRDFACEQSTLGQFNYVTDVERLERGKKSLLPKTPTWGSCSPNENTVLEIFTINRVKFPNQKHEHKRRSRAQCLLVDSSEYRHNYKRKRRHKRQRARSLRPRESARREHCEFKAEENPDWLTSIGLSLQREEGETWKQVYKRVYSRAATLLCQKQPQKVVCQKCQTKTAELMYHSRAMKVIKYTVCSVCSNVRVLESTNGDMDDIAEAFLGG